MITLSHEQKVVLWVSMRLEEMQKEGLLGGGKLKTKIASRFAYAMQVDDNFKPTGQEIIRACIVLFGQGKQARDVIELLFLKNGFSLT